MDSEIEQEDDFDDLEASTTTNISSSRFVQSLLPTGVPSDWQLVAAGRAVTSSQYGLSEPEDRNGDTRIVGMKHLRDGKVVDEDLGIIQSGGADLSSYRLQAGDLLLNRTNSPDLVGKVAVVETTTDAVFASYLVRLRAADDVDPRFLNYWLNSDIAQRAIKRISTRAISQANVNPTEFKRNCPVPLPPLLEQNRIVGILQTWDEGIEAAERLIAAHAKRQSWLIGAIAFGRQSAANGVNDSRRKRGDWFSVPLHWEIQPIRELASEMIVRNTERMVSEVLSCSKHRGFVRSLDYFGKQIFSADLNAYKIIRRGEFGFPANHVEEGSIGLQNIADVGVVSPIYVVFRFEASRVNERYAFRVLKTELFRHLFEISTSASVDRRGSLRWAQFSKLPFPVPPIPEQEKIVQILDEQDRLIDAARRQRDALQRQKRGLMQKLLTGEWRTAQSGGSE